MNYYAYVFLGFIFVLLLKLLRPRKLRGKVIPGPPGLPLVGCGLDVTEQNMPHVCFSYSETYGDIVQLKLFNTNVILINSLELFQTAVSGDIYKEYFNDRPAYFYNEHFLFGSQGVIAYKEGYNSVHSDLRKVLIKGLHVYGEGTKEFEEKIANNLENVIKRIENYGDGEFEFIDEMKMSFCNLLSILVRFI
jgi:hypothetical protein